MHICPYRSGFLTIIGYYRVLSGEVSLVGTTTVRVDSRIPGQYICDYIQLPYSIDVISFGHNLYTA